MRNKRLFKLCGIIQIVTMAVFLFIMIGVIISSKGQSVEMASIHGKIIIIDVIVTVTVYVITSSFMYKYQMWESDELDRLMEKHFQLLDKCKYL